MRRAQYRTEVDQECNSNAAEVEQKYSSLINIFNKGI